MPGNVVEVALDTPADDRFDYLGTDIMRPGDLVVVPFGHRQLSGVVVGRATASDVPADRLREVSQHLDWLAPLPADWRALTGFSAAYYHRRLGEVMLPALPPGLRDPKAWASLRNRAVTARYRAKLAHIDTLLAAVPVRARSVKALAQALAERAGEAA